MFPPGAHYVSAHNNDVLFFNKLVEFTVKFQTAYSRIEFVESDSILIRVNWTQPC